MKTITTMTQKGQITIPIAFRQKLGLVRDSKVKFDFVSLRGYFKTNKKYSKAKARKAYLKDVVENKI